jgi:hypothetical protein
MTPACWSVLSGKLLAMPDKICIGQVIFRDGGNLDRLRPRSAAPAHNYVVADSGEYL